MCSWRSCHPRTLPWRGVACSARPKASVPLCSAATAHTQPLSCTRHDAPAGHAWHACVQNKVYDLFKAHPDLLPAVEEGMSKGE